MDTRIWAAAGVYSAPRNFSVSFGRPPNSCILCRSPESPLSQTYGKLHRRLLMAAGKTREPFSAAEQGTTSVSVPHLRFRLAVRSFASLCVCNWFRAPRGSKYLQIPHLNFHRGNVSMTGVDRPTADKSNWNGYFFVLELRVRRRHVTFGQTLYSLQLCEKHCTIIWNIDMQSIKAILAEVSFAFHYFIKTQHGKYYFGK